MGGEGREMGNEEERERREQGKEKEGSGRYRPLFANSWVRPCDLRSLINRADRQRFHELNTTPQHCPAPISPPERYLETRSTLRARGHRFSLPQCKSKLFENAYLNRVLFWHFYF